MLVINVPGRGVAKFSFFFTGPEDDQYTFVKPYVQWNDVHVPHLGQDAELLFDNVQPPTLLLNIARASGVDTSNWVDTYGSIPPGHLGPSEISKWYRLQPRAEVDRLTMKWWTDVLAPKLAAFLTRVLGSRLGEVSATSGYTNIQEYLTANLVKFNPTLTNGTITLSR